MKKNYAIEFLRFFFTLGVVVGHAYTVFFQNNNPTYTIIFHNACVDFFFVLSGFLMARHFENFFNVELGRFVVLDPVDYRYGTDIPTPLRLTG